MRSVALVLALALSLLGSTRARADGPDVPDAPRTPQRDVYFQGGVGGGIGTDFATVHEDLGIMFRWRFLTTGVSGHFQIALGESVADLLGGSVHAGYGLRQGSWRFDLLGTFGAHRYRDVGRDAMEINPGVDATLPYAGGQARVAYMLGSRPNRRFLLGLLGSVDADLWRKTFHYETDYSGVLGWAVPEEPVTQRVGGVRGTLVLTFGVLFDAP
jgi:hypothetical protein